MDEPATAPQPRASFPPPVSISPEARAALEAAIFPSLDYPCRDDRAGWRAFVRNMDEALSEQPPGRTDPRISSSEVAYGDVRTVIAAPQESQGLPGKIYLDFHGGALVFLGGEAVDGLARDMAHRTGRTVVSVDYRMPPDHPFPAGIHDGLAVYRALLETHPASDIAIGGASAGGNIAAAVMLLAKAHGLPLPSALVLLSPEVDLTESGDTFATLLGLDRMSSLMPINLLYAGGEDLRNPLVSPLFGDFASFPPTFLQSGTRDLFLSNTVRMHRRLRDASVEAELHVWEAMPHPVFIGAPEDAEVDFELRRFLDRNLG